MARKCLVVEAARLASITALMAAVAACGGGASSGSPSPSPAPSPTPSPSPSPAPAPAGPPTHADAFRLMTQGTFGPIPADVAGVMASSDAAWVNAQLALPNTSAYVTQWDADNAVGLAGQNSIYKQFYTQARTSPDQLRQRVAFALSEIMVTSMRNFAAAGTRAGASYMDMLNRDAFANFRVLLEDVAMHPMMGQYLTSLHNPKENPTTGAEPDQNFAREVMQLMTIGLTQLNVDGSQKLSGGNPIDTYSTADVVGMSKVMTGFSWAGPDTSSSRFYGSTGFIDANRDINPMQSYPQYTSISEKNFLGTSIPAKTVPDGMGDLKIALDALYSHPNVGPFIGRQLIQRLVESNPSSAYVGRVASVFNDNGSGVRGDMAAVVRAILLDPEARAATPASDFGKVREPVLRFTAWMRAFNTSSDSGHYLMWDTSDPSNLGMAPLMSGSVFNFFRPAYIPPGTLTGAKNMTVPEMQITNEATVAGYVNYMSAAVRNGGGPKGPSNTGTRPDIQPDYTAETSVVSDTNDLVDEVTLKLIGDSTPDSLKWLIRSAVNSYATPAASASSSVVAAWQQNRINSAVLLTLVSPEFIVQK